MFTESKKTSFSSGGMKVFCPKKMISYCLQDNTGSNCPLKLLKPTVMQVLHKHPQRWLVDDWLQASDNVTITGFDF